MGSSHINSMRIAPSLHGNGLLTSEPRDEHQLLLSESPYVCVLTQSALSSHCSNCWKPAADEKTPLKRCGGCKNTFYCGRDCQTRDFVYGRHKGECKAVGDRKEDLVRLAARFLFRLNQDKNVPARAHELCADSGGAEEEQQHYTELSFLLSGRLTAQGCRVTAMECRKTFARLLCNVMRVLDGADGAPLASALYLTGSAANHSATPNASPLFAGPRLLMVAKRPIEADGIVTLSYIDDQLPRGLQRHLLRKWNIIIPDDDENDACWFCSVCQKSVSLPSDVLWSLYESVGDSGTTGGPKERELFLKHASKCDTAAPCHSEAIQDAHSLATFAAQATEAASVAHFPGHRAAELIWGRVQKCARPGSYFWITALRRFALHSVKISKMIAGEAELHTLLLKAVDLNQMLTKHLTDSVSLLGCFLTMTKSLMWIIAYEPSPDIHKQLRECMGRTRELERRIFRPLEGEVKHALQTDMASLEAQFDEYQQWMQQNGILY